MKHMLTESLKIFKNYLNLAFCVTLRTQLRFSDIRRSSEGTAKWMLCHITALSNNEQIYCYINLLKKLCRNDSSHQLHFQFEASVVLLPHSCFNPLLPPRRVHKVSMR